MVDSPSENENGGKGMEGTPVSLQGQFPDRSPPDTMMASPAEDDNGADGTRGFSLPNTDDGSQSQKRGSKTTSHEPKETRGNSPSIVGEGRDGKSGQHSKGNHSKKNKEKKQKNVRVSDGEHQNRTLDSDEVGRRKSNLLLCDSAAAAALGNFVALQQAQARAGEGQQGNFNEEQFFDDLQSKDLGELAAKSAMFANRLEEIREQMKSQQSFSVEECINSLKESSKEKTIYVGLALEREVAEALEKDGQASISTYNAKRTELQQQQQRLLIREQLLRKRILSEYEKRDVVVKLKRKQLEEEERARQEHFSKLLRRGQCHLFSMMKKQHAELSSVYGMVRHEDEYAAVSKSNPGVPHGPNDILPLGASYRVEWDRAPQHLRLRVDTCRAVKDKVPMGEYVLSASIWDKIGGSRLNWSTVKLSSGSLSPSLDSSPPLVDGVEASAAASTKAILFEATHLDECMQFNQMLHLACPSKRDTHASMCIIFELYLLRGLSTPLDTVIAWGAFPLLDSDLRIIQGSFKVPLLKGPVDPSVKRYADLEQQMKTSVDVWLCNLYFSAFPLPHYIDGQVEVELQVEPTGVIQTNNHASSATEGSRGNTNISLQEATSNVHQLVNALKACEEVSDDGTAIVSKNGLRAWRHKETYSKTQGTVRPQFEEYTPSVYFGTTLLHPQEIFRKRQYLLSAVFGDYKLSSDRRELSSLFCALLGVVVALWFCVFTHVLGVWLALRANRIPIYNMELLPLYLRLEYVQEVLSLTTLAVVALGGPLACLVSFVILCFASNISHKVVGRMPNLAYRFLSPLGMMTAVSPIVLWVVETAAGEASGVTFSLFNYFLRKEGNGSLGVLLTLVIDLPFIILGSLTFYGYAKWIHNNGQVIDAHRRLTGDSSTFVIPSDFEISESYVQWCCQRANEYKGPNGEVRRTHIASFTLHTSEENWSGGGGSTSMKHSVANRSNKAASRVAAYIAIYTVDPSSGTQSLYRHFVRHPNGRLSEYSTEMNSADDQRALGVESQG